MALHFNHEGKDYTFDDGKFSIAEARWVKRTFNLSTKQIMDGLNELDVDAILAVFSISLKRGGVVINTVDDIPVDMEDENGFWNLVESMGAVEDKPAVVPNRTERRKPVPKG